MKTTLKKEEKIILEVRKHWLTLAIPLLISFVLFVAGILIHGLGLILSGVGMLIIAYKIVDWHNNLWAVTNLRIVDEKGVLTSNSKESPLEKINNVSYHQSFWGKIFGFGSVQIQTAAEIGATTVNMLEKPKLLKDTITQMQEEYKQMQITRQAKEMANAIVSAQNNDDNVAEELEKLFSLKQKGAISDEEYASLKTKILKGES
jgi:uncharacterized membrane protein YdbT with pleckstrin-like domain